VPYPLEKGDKLRAYHHIRELSKHHDLIVCALSDKKIHPEAYDHLKPFTHSLYFFRLSAAGIYSRLVTAVFSQIPFQVAYFHSSRVEAQIQALINTHQPEHVFCQLIRTAAFVADIPADKTIDYQDGFSAGLLRRKQVAPWYMKPLLSAEYKRVSKYEHWVFGKFDKKTIISVHDRALIPHPDRDRICVVPNGVDTGFFRPASRDKTFDILFTGNMAYPPNINGARYLVEKIMPMVWRQRPYARVAIVGASPTARVRALASDRVKVSGWVDDIREYYAGSRIFVAPMQIGTGLQNKVLEAMAMGLPCVSSPLANQAIGATQGHEILIGRKEEEYAQLIVSLLQDTGLHQKVRENALLFVKKQFSWADTSRTLGGIITGPDPGVPEHEPTSWEKNWTP